MVGSSLIPVIAGLAIGIAFVGSFAIVLRPDILLSDNELIAKYSKFDMIRYFIERHPDAEAKVERYLPQQVLSVSYSVEKQVEPASDLYSGINTLKVSADNRRNHLTFSISCGVHQGVTIEYTSDEISAIDAGEENCFQTPGNHTGVFEPDISGNYLNDQVYQFAFMP